MGTVEKIPATTWCAVEESGDGIHLWAAATPTLCVCALLQAAAEYV